MAVSMTLVYDYDAIAVYDILDIQLFNVKE